MSEPKPLQFFLDPSGVSTVSLEADERTLSCDCIAYRRSKDQTCKHVLWVNDRVDPKTGAFPVQVSKRATEDEMRNAFGGADMATYRDFLFKYGRVEVLEEK